MRKSAYAKMFTHRADGYYQKKVKGKVLYDKDPEKLYQKWQAELAAESAPPREKTFREVAEEWERSHREEITIRSWNNYKPHYEELVKRYGDKPIKNITAKDVANELAAVKSKGYGIGVAKRYKALFNLILDSAVLSEDISYNPARVVKMPKGLKNGKRSAPTEEEMKVIVENINLPFGFFPYFLLFTGMRKCEALALTVDDIDLIHRSINVTKTLVYNDGSNPTVKSPKTKSGIRVIPIVAALYRPLTEYLSTVEEIVFPSSKKRNDKAVYMRDCEYRRQWKRYCEAAGLDLTAHQLRHGMATVMFEAGVDAYTAQRILGHANITTTMSIYTELRDSQMAKSVEKLDQETLKYVSAVSERKS